MIEFIKNINAVEILKLGAIGLGFLLAVLSFLIINKEQRKKNPSGLILKITQTFMVFSISMVILSIVSEFLMVKPELSMNLGEKKLTIQEIQAVKENELDLNNYFVNSELGFAFKKPNKNWSKIQVERGVSGGFKLMGIESEFITEEKLTAGLQQSPLGKLYLNSTHYYFFNPDSQYTLNTTNSTGNPEIEATLKQIAVSNNLFDLDTTDVEGKQAYIKKLQEYRRQLVGFSKLEIKEAFILTAFPKEFLPEYQKNLTLPSFFINISQIFGNNADKLIANEKQILAGTEIKLANVEIENKQTDLNNKKWFMFTENDHYFFLVEINYPASISSSISRWDELQNILNSFKLIN